MNEIIKKIKLEIDIADYGGEDRIRISVKLLKDVLKLLEEMGDKGVDEWVTTDLERTVNGIMCAAKPKCRECNFHCAKWMGNNYSASKNVRIIREVLKKWEQVM